jgi:hypothetical protein
MNTIFIALFSSLVLFANADLTEKKFVGGQKKAKRIAFKTFLKNNGLSLDLTSPNRFETLQGKNKYSNHYFNFSTDLPDNWEIDRGNAINTVIRSISPDTGSQISIIVIPFESKKGHDDFQKNPIATLDRSYGGSYFEAMKKITLQNITSEAFDFSITTKRIRSINYTVFSYKYIEVTDNVEVEFTSTQFQTVLWNTIFDFNYTTPSMFYSDLTILDVLQSTNYINPNSLITY